MKISKAIRLLLVPVAITVLSACAPKDYVIQSPSPSGMSFEGAATQSLPKLGFNDVRPIDQRVFSSGVLPASLKSGQSPIDPPVFLATSLQAELKSRGVQVEVTPGDKALPYLDLRTYRIQNHRVSAYSPFVTLTFLSVDLQTGPATRRIGVFVKRGKVPVWSFDEIVEPTLNQPLSLATKELASKIAGTLASYKSSDKAVDDLIAKLATRSDNSFLDVYALGFTNNSKAIPTLVGLTKDTDEYVRLAAISSLGNVGASSQFALLKSLYEQQDGLWQDRAMALKAIGDLGLPESKELLEQELKRLSSGQSDNDAKWTTQIIALYL